MDFGYVLDSPWSKNLRGIGGNDYAPLAHDLGFEVPARACLACVGKGTFQSMAGLCPRWELLSGPVRLSGASMQKDLRNEGGDFVNSCISDVSGSRFR